MKHDKQVINHYSFEFCELVHNVHIVDMMCADVKSARLSDWVYVNLWRV